MSVVDCRYLKGKLSKKELEYMQYIDDHRALVWQVWQAVKKHDDFDPQDQDVVLQTERQAYAHDESKYSPEEFYAYRQAFYPEEGEDKVDMHEWQAAVQHHYRNNSHHWQYHVHSIVFNASQALPMGQSDVLEMLCDWTAMSLTAEDHYSTTPSEWYYKKRRNFALHQDTQQLIEYYLPLFDVVFNEIKGYHGDITK